MKICITSSGNSMESKLDMRFGRCAYFAIVDLESGESTFIENEAGMSSQGAGISSGRLMTENDVKAVITGNLGPNASDVLKTAKIDAYRGKEGSINENIEAFKANSLNKIDNTVPSHFGMGQGRGR